MPFSDVLPFPIFGNMAEIPRRVVAVLDTDIRRLLRTYGRRPGSSMVMPFSEDSQSCLNKVRPRTGMKSGFRASSMARNVPRPSVISSGVAEGGGCGALPFPCAGRTHRKPRYPIPRWARVEVFPVSMTEMLRTVRIQWLPLPPAASRNARRTTPSVYVLSAPSEVVPWLASPSMRMRGSASA